MKIPLRDRLETALGAGYVIEEELSGGGMSRVYLAYDTTADRRVVVKVLPPEFAAAVSIKRFRREIHVAGRLQHPNIVPLLSAGEIDGIPFYLMPFVEGESLRRRLLYKGVTIAQAIPILRDVVSALSHAHERRVVHRDIKPENILLAGGSAVVTDFGVAKAIDASSPDSTGLTSVGVVLGTPAYMAPEQAASDPSIDGRADLYAFGAMAYEMVAGHDVFPARSSMQMMAAHARAIPKPLLEDRPDTPVALAELVMRCLEKRPQDRPQSADEVLRALDAVVVE